MVVSHSDRQVGLVPRRDQRRWVWYQFVSFCGEALADESAQAAERVEEEHDTAQLRNWLLAAMQGLSEREQFIVRERKLRDPARTLESLGDELSLSKERVRQLEAAAFGKMRKSLEMQSREVFAFLA